MEERKNNKKNDNEYDTTHSIVYLAHTRHIFLSKSNIIWPRCECSECVRARAIERPKNNASLDEPFKTKSHFSSIGIHNVNRKLCTTALQYRCSCSSPSSSSCQLHGIVQCNSYKAFAHRHLNFLESLTSCTSSLQKPNTQKWFCFFFFCSTCLPMRPIFMAVALSVSVSMHVPFFLNPYTDVTILIALV